MNKVRCSECKSEGILDRGIPEEWNDIDKKLVKEFSIRL